jgi:hypothetical protein
MKKVLICGVALAFLCSLGLAGMSLANDKGPAELTLESTIDKAKKVKPAHFPHAKHQEKLKCGKCHHTKGADGKQAAYSEGMKIEKCESCHNKAAGMPKGLETFKNAAHKNCKGCHKKTGNKALTKCGICHPKKK